MEKKKTKLKQPTAGKTAKTFPKSEKKKEIVVLEKTLDLIKNQQDILEKKKEIVYEKIEKQTEKEYLYDELNKLNYQLEIVNKIYNEIFYKVYTKQFGL